MSEWFTETGKGVKEMCFIAWRALRARCDAVGAAQRVQRAQTEGWKYVLGGCVS